LSLSLFLYDITLKDLVNALRCDQKIHRWEGKYTLREERNKTLFASENRKEETKLFVEVSEGMIGSTGRGEAADPG
jgi:hypothetical protein